VTRILVIGRTGQLARALSRAGGGIRPFFLGRDALDLADTARIAPEIARHAPEVVINAAAYTAVDQAESEPEAARLINVAAVGEIARGASEAGAALVHVSTDYVYPGTGETPHRENDATGPANVYGHTKLAGEQAARAALDRLVILRTSWVYSPWGRNFVRTMLRLSGRDTLRVVADQHGQPTSALDLAEACLAIAPRLAAAGPDAPFWGVHHYAGVPPTTWADFAETIFAEAPAGLREGRPHVERIGTAAFPTPARRPLNSRLDCTRFERCFGIEMIPWRDALRRVLTAIATEGGT
jgi:dTDP-4-dehydrorhamnose reductase